MPRLPGALPPDGNGEPPTGFRPPFFWMLKTAIESEPWFTANSSVWAWFTTIWSLPSTVPGIFSCVAPAPPVMHWEMSTGFVPPWLYATARTLLFCEFAMFESE